MEFKPFGRKFWSILLVFASIITIIMFFPYLFSTLSWVEWDVTKGKDIGLAINGLTAPFIAVIASGLTFVAFWVQLQANFQLRNDIKRDRFETQFYEMLKLHKANVDEITINSRHKGRKAFVKMFEEFRYIYFKLEEETFWEFENIKLNDTEKVKVAYQCFFFGINRNSGKCNQIPDDKNVAHFVNKLSKELHGIQTSYKPNQDTYIADVKGAEWKCDFFPFDGHVSKLGHYFRHLYHLVKMIADNEELNIKNNLSEEMAKRYQFIRIIRAQLSNHEQAILYWNSLWQRKDVWWFDKDISNRKNLKGLNISYFIDYKLIKNLPFNLTNFGEDAKKIFIKKIKEQDKSLSTEDAKNMLPNILEWME